ncbi:hypothetical protein IWX92DRAFT_388059 [Phyllosticta citricarpa]
MRACEGCLLPTSDEPKGTAWRIKAARLLNLPGERKRRRRLNQAVQGGKRERRSHDVLAERSHVFAWKAVHARAANGIREQEHHELVHQAFGRVLSMATTTVTLLCGSTDGIRHGRAEDGRLAGPGRDQGVAGSGRKSREVRPLVLEDIWKDGDDLQLEETRRNEVERDELPDVEIDDARENKKNGARLGRSRRVWETELSRLRRAVPSMKQRWRWYRDDGGLVGQWYVALWKRRIRDPAGLPSRMTRGGEFIFAFLVVDEQARRPDEAGPLRRSLPLTWWPLFGIFSSREIFRHEFSSFRGRRGSFSLVRGGVSRRGRSKIKDVGHEARGNGCRRGFASAKSQSPADGNQTKRPRADGIGLGHAAGSRRRRRRRRVGLIQAASSFNIDTRGGD